MQNCFSIIIVMSDVHHLNITYLLTKEVENTKSIHCDLYSFIFEAIRSKNVFPEYFYKMSILYFNHRWYASVYNTCENLYWNALLFEISLSFFDWSSKLAVGNYHIGNFFCCLLFHFYHCLYFLGTLFLCQRQ